MGARRVAWISAFALTMGYTVTALADPPPPAGASPPSSSATPSSPPPPEAKEAVSSNPEKPKESGPQPVSPNEGHFRWGVSPSIGTFFPGPTTLAFGVEGRLGWALNQTVTVFGSFGGVAGVGFGASGGSGGGSVSASAISYWYLGGNVDALLAGPLFVGGGAAIGRGGWAVGSISASAAGGSEEAIVAGGLMPSLNGVIGLATGTLNPYTGKRGGFSIALDMRVLIAPDATSTKNSAGTGGVAQNVTTSTTALGVSPMLLIGYDSR